MGIDCVVVIYWLFKIKGVYDEIYYYVKKFGSGCYG